MQPKERKQSGKMSILIGAGVGAVLGFAYYKFIGCASGACPITSNPWISTFYGALMGGLLASGGSRPA